MARKRKTRTHLKDPNAQESKNNVPKSFIIKHGQVGSSLTQLVRDMRKVMEPNTASRLKERNRNKLKDFLTMGPALKVTHIMAFTLTPLAPSMRIVKLSDGPTLSFRIERYSLMKDVLNTAKRARSVGMEYLSPPLLVLASFPPPSPTTPPHLPLLMKSFQSLFPPLSPQTISLSSARRVVLLAYNAERGTVEFRHFIIKIKPYGVSRRVRKVLEGTHTSKNTSGVLDLGNEKDVADFLLRARGMPGPDGYESASSAESEAGDDGNAVDLAGDYVGRNNKRGQRRAVRLEEVGPRMELRLIKIAEGVPGKEGAVLYHEFVKKSKKEVAAQKAEHAAKEKLRKQRREEQERNVQRKKAEALKKGKKPQAEDEEEEEEDEEEEDVSQSEGEGEEGEDDGIGQWDEDENIDDTDEEEPVEESEEESSEDEAPPPAKRSKTRRK
ncbi:Brix domain-containing protein [Panaeolus papilionaceus]|nr:Brix domain-containing protein [Panaeolus papilionaceus]